MKTSISEFGAMFLLTVVICNAIYLMFVGHFSEYFLLGTLIGSGLSAIGHAIYEEFHG